MVIESLINPQKAERKPWLMIGLGFIYTIISVLASYWIFRQYSSIVSVFFIALISASLIYSTLRYEERFGLRSLSERNTLIEHFRALDFLILLFVGFVIGYIFVYLFFPQDMVSSLFKAQYNTLNQINGGPTSNFVADIVFFAVVFFNNVKVLILSFLFSFVFGLGAIFILAWNASIISYAIGQFITSKVGFMGGGLGAYAVAMGWAFLRYFIHGLPEIAAYFLGGMAGGIISVAIIRKDIYGDKADKIYVDAIDLLLIAILILVFAGLIETFVSPMLM
jgi:uncharacterized membrane protein SpoIIM required for sporulation